MTSSGASGGRQTTAPPDGAEGALNRAWRDGKLPMDGMATVEPFEQCGRAGAIRI